LTRATTKRRTASIWKPAATYVNIHGFTIENSDGSIARAGIRVAECDYVNIEDNNVSGAGDWEIYTSFSDNGLIENNVTSGSLNQHGIYIANSADNVQVIDNTVYGNAQCGIQFNGDLSQGGTGICSDDLIEGNVIYDNGSAGGAAINGDGLQNSTIEDNLIYANTHTGIALFQDDSAAGPSGDVVVGNTVVMPGNQTAIEVESPAGTNVVFNNIFIGTVFSGFGNRRSRQLFGGDGAVESICVQQQLCAIIDESCAGHWRGHVRWPCGAGNGFGWKFVRTGCRGVSDN